jgi:hypothetical protein
MKPNDPDLERALSDFARIGEALENGKVSTIVLFAELHDRASDPQPVIFVNVEPSVGATARLIGFLEHIKTAILSMMTRAMTRPNAAINDAAELRQVLKPDRPH